MAAALPVTRSGLQVRLASRAALVVAATLGLALIVMAAAAALLGGPSPPHLGKPRRAVIVTVPVRRAAVTASRTDPAVTVTEHRPCPTVTVRPQMASQASALGPPGSVAEPGQGLRSATSAGSGPLESLVPANPRLTRLAGFCGTRRCP